jgi:hypothetical protein
MEAPAAAIAHLKSAAEIAWTARWQMSWDMNHDDVVNLADLWLLTSWFFFAPGDAILLLAMMYATPVALFLGIDLQSLSGILSGTISAIVWLVTIGYFARRA